MARILVTGVAGFIGFHVARHLLARGDEVIGIDNLNDYYDVRLKQHRIAEIESEENFEFHLFDVANRREMQAAFEDQHYDVVIHLAAQAGVRHSLTHPHEYIDTNLVGFGNILEGCRHAKAGHLVYASSSSVYGGSEQLPFSVHRPADHPLSLYAATKRANELMAHSYSHLYQLPATGLRFFTVYGPWGRPDMAMFLFTRSILAGEPIDVFGEGNMRRDFTYIDDIVDGVVRVADRTATPAADWNPQSPDPATSCCPHRLYNVGNHRPVELTYVIELLERNLGKPARRNLLPMQPGDVRSTCADIDSIARDIDFQPRVSIEAGVENFVRWYREYYDV
ncbi:MAG: NAD-dependent epimerase [Planctomycetaceae bacterium]